ncbi:cytochrome c biogenesis CcdA family protein [Kallipyga massiliensis]|uniref:cytochrome c biogenesis CcdA family protein n=1 Tax=Kallipyga massiliensis TaxID=1472764 RepID=UPI0026F04767|nr:cytochrome c biogenesis CcdA family protein [Kallipyga massiliensis]
MPYLLSFLEGLITFISPCLLPMLPIYLAYFGGGGGRTRSGMVKNVLVFILGFTLVFMAMGALAGSLGFLLRKHRVLINLLTGGVVVFFGLQYLGFFQLSLFRGMGAGKERAELTPWKSFLFGLTFSLAWTPCLGSFLGAALMLAGQQAHMVEGLAMLLAYSMGLAIPFFLSALLIDQLESTFDGIKAHYGTIQKVSGMALVIMGLLMATGLLQRLFTVLS